ncbi:MAG: hypothetical protein Q8K68_01360 [Nitrospirota bacterium]|nr:hypothetical protein [Nitrospirota bacterium]
MKNRKTALITIVLLFSFFLLAGNCMALSIDPPKITPLEARPVLTSVHAHEGMEWKGHISDQKEEFIKVVADKKEWDELWKRAFDKPAPEVDFEKYVVACIFLGHDADWLYSIWFDNPYERNSKLVIPFDLSEIILELSGPFKASGQYHMKVFKKQKGAEMILENTSRFLKRK